MYNLIILISLFILISHLIIFTIIMIKKKINPIGKTSINKRVFIIGKISILIPFFFIFFQSIGIHLSFFQTSNIVSTTGITAFIIGEAIFLIAIYSLGMNNLRMGFPKEKTKLITTGIYKLSRNPIYLGLYLMFIGSSLYVLNPFNWVSSLFTILIHHKIILSEENFLDKKFKQEWRDYKRLVRRYI